MSISPPRNWINIQLNDLIILLIGGDWGIPAEQHNDNYTLVKVIRGTDFKTWDTERANLAEVRAIKTNSLNRRKLSLGDIVLEVSGGSPDQPVGRTVVIDQKTLQNESLPLVCSNFFRKIRLTKEVNTFYINHYFSYRYKKGGFNNIQNQSTNLKNLRVPEFIKIDIPIPTYQEQSAIVDKLEEILTRVHETRNQIESIPNLVNEFKQLVLSYAASGELTKDFRKSSTNTNIGKSFLRKLISFRKEKYKALVKEAAELGINKPRPLKLNEEPINTVDLQKIPKSWIWTRLINLGEVTGGVTKGRNLSGKETIELPYLRVANVQDGFLDLSDVKTIIVLPEDLEKFRLEYNDILFTEGGDRDKLGRGTVWKSEIQNCIHQNHIFRLRAEEKFVVPDYISIFTKTKIPRDYFYAHASQTVNLASISLNTLSNVPIALPPIAEQMLIVEKVNELFVFADNLLERYRTSKDFLEKVVELVLEKAFSGKLLEKEFPPPDLNVLLEAIQIEKQRFEADAKQKNEAMTQQTDKTKKIEDNSSLVSIVKKAFGHSTFSFHQLKAKSAKSYSDLKEELFELLDRGVIDMAFDPKNETMKFKLIKDEDKKD